MCCLKQTKTNFTINYKTVETSLYVNSCLKDYVANTYFLNFHQQFLQLFRWFIVIHDILDIVSLKPQFQYCPVDDILPTSTVD